MRTPALTDSATDEAAVPLRAALAAELAEAALLAGTRLLVDPGWRHAIETVPRHWFVPGFYQEGGRSGEHALQVWEPVTENLDRGGWLAGIYQDQTLITQLDGDEPDWGKPLPRVGGSPTSSSTLPSLVLRMWADADLRDGHKVLEIGTGTGYSIALASQRFGSTRLTSVEVDPDRLDQAAKGLRACGYAPGLAVADGLYGYRPNAPYDRIVAACSVRKIPQEWLDQITPGGKILTTLSGWMYGFARVLITVGADGTAEGPLLPGTISFMLARTDTPPMFGPPSHWEVLTRDVAGRQSRHDPARIGEPTEEGFFAQFLAQLAAPNTQRTSAGDLTYLVDVVSGSAASITPEGQGWSVRQAGPVRMWDAIEAAMDAWDQAGRPGPELFRMRIDSAGQHIFHPAVPDLAYTLP